MTSETFVHRDDVRSGAVGWSIGGNVGKKQGDEKETTGK